MPGTPSRKEKIRESSALQDPGLKDYRLGECLGKGAFGSVYKAFNWGNGEAVAVKQIKLADLPKSELRMIESEIDLLKNLHHDNIVKYIGFVKSVDALNIILEYESKLPLQILKLMDIDTVKMVPYTQFARHTASFLRIWSGFT
jgi:serine/threonine protein kinase